jgi:hypothetical protein
LARAAFRTPPNHAYTRKPRAPAAIRNRRAML